MAPVRRFAEGTSVSVAKSKVEIESILSRFGASSFASGFDGDRVAVMFEAHGRRIRFVMTIPTVDDPQFARDGRGARRTPSARATAAAAEERRLWRSLALAIKAKLDVVESGIATFEEEFAAHVVLPDGSMAGSHIIPAIDHAYATGAMPPLLALGGGS